MKKLSSLSIMLLTVGSVDSIRNVPAIAVAGKNMLPLFGFALLTFLLPLAVISCWFSQQNDQGVYGWVRQSLGSHWGCLAIWLQCLQNIFCYPAFLSFIVGTFIYGLAPQLLESKLTIFLLILLIFWSLTLINSKGLSLSDQFSKMCTIIGLLIPFALIIAIGAYYGFSSQLPLSITSDFNQSDSLTAIILSLCGVEIAAVHRNQCEHKAFVKGVLLAVPIICITLILAVLSVQSLVPPKQLSMIAGVMQTFDTFFNQHHHGELTIILSILMAIGCLACANNWLIAPIKGLKYSFEDLKSSNKLWQKSKKASLNHLLIAQATTVSLISCAYLSFESVNQCYWFFVTMTTTMYLLMYILMLIGATTVAMKSRNIFILCCSLLGLAGCSFAMYHTLSPLLVLFPFSFDD